MAAVLKFFKQHLFPNCNADSVQTWWEALEWHRDSELQESFQYLRWLPWNSSDLICSWMVSQIEPKLGGRHLDDMEIQNCYDIHDSHHSNRLEDFQLLAHLELCPGQLMLWSVDHGPSLMRMSVSNFSHFRHLHQNHIHDDPCEVANILSWRVDREMFSTVILCLPLIQEGQLSVSCERMCTILVNHLVTS